MAQRPEGSPVEPGIIARAAAGLRYVWTGQTPKGWMGPGQTVPAQAQETQGRAFDFPSGYNTRTRPQRESGISFGELRALSRSYDLLRLMIETRKDQLEKLDWTIQPKVRAGEVASAIRKNRAHAARQFLERPDGFHDWSQWLRQVVEDMLVIDAATIYPRLANGGGLYALEVVDGATIKRVIDHTGRTPLPPDAAYQQILKGIPASDFTRDELVYYPRNLASDRLYGFSPVEQIVMTVNIALRRQMRQLSGFTAGNLPDSFMGVPETWTAQQIADFQAYWDSLMLGDEAVRRQVRFVTKTMADSYKPVVDRVEKDMFDEWLARIVAFAFSVSPTPLISQVNRAVADSSFKQATEEGLQPLMLWVKRLMDRIVAQFFGSDLEFAWADTKSIDPEAQARIDVAYVNARVVTINEVRDARGLAPVAWGDEPVAALAAPPSEEDGTEEAPKPEPDGAEEPPVQRFAKGLKTVAPKGMAKAAKARTKALTAALKPILKAKAREIADKIASGLSKIEKDEPSEDDPNRRASDILDSVDFGDWSDLQEIVHEYVSDTFDDAGSRALASLSVMIGDQDREAMLDVVNKKAVRYAKDRAAALVGKGRNMALAITETTRDMIRSQVVLAIEEGWSSAKLADELMTGEAFGASRAEMIARTEVATAQGQGTLTGWQESGVVSKKVWLTAGDDQVSEECRSNEAAGPIALNGQWPNGVTAPPSHPNCRCDQAAVIED